MACFGVDDLCNEFRKQDDEYNIIMVKALGDRLAEVRAFITCFLATFSKLRATLVQCKWG